LLELAEKKGRKVGFETEVRKFITHQEIANLTATSRQTVTTLLNDLRERNILTFDRRRLLIRNLEALEKEALAATA
jgi:CRP-like cAMP-binding protein